MNLDDVRGRIESAELDETRQCAEVALAVEETIVCLTRGAVRAAEPDGSGGWRVNAWVKKAILLYFKMRPSRRIKAGELEFRDKVDLWTDFDERGVRCAPGGLVRKGAYVGPKVILMPCFVNIGAYVGQGTMIDTWATVGSCAQIGARCHISGGAGIGGVLEPIQAEPVIIEDHCFIGARCEVAEGVRVGEGAVLAMGCYVGASTKVYDATRGVVFPASDGIPPRAVLVPGSLPSADGTHQTYALILKKYRDGRTDARTALNEALR